MVSECIAKVYQVSTYPRTFQSISKCAPSSFSMSVDVSCFSLLFCEPGIGATKHYDVLSIFLKSLISVILYCSPSSMALLVVQYTLYLWSIVAGLVMEGPPCIDKAPLGKQQFWLVPKGSVHSCH